MVQVVEQQQSAINEMMQSLPRPTPRRRQQGCSPSPAARGQTADLVVCCSNLPSPFSKARRRPNPHPPVPHYTPSAPSEQYGIGNRIVPNRHARKPVGDGVEAVYGLGNRVVQSHSRMGFTP